MRLSCLPGVEVSSVTLSLLFNVTADNVNFDGFNITSTANANCLNFTSTTAAGNVVKNCTIKTNEFGIIAVNVQIQMQIFLNSLGALTVIVLYHFHE